MKDLKENVIRRTYTASADMQIAADITGAPASRRKVVITDLIVSVGAAMTISILMETSGNVLAKFFLPANGTVVVPLQGYLKGDAAGKKIKAQASASGNVAITAVWFTE